MTDMRSQNKGLLVALRSQKGWLAIWLVEGGWLLVLMVEGEGEGGGGVGWPKDRGWLHHKVYTSHHNWYLSTIDSLKFANPA